MEVIINFFENIPSAYRTIILVSGLMFFWILEGLIPVFQPKKTRLTHAGLNLFFTLTTILVNFCFAWIIVLTCDWSKTNHFGLLYAVNMPSWLMLIIGVLLLDLIGAYLIHFLEHKIRIMWVFHLIHHTDTEVDVTTANRHHPGESVFRFVFTFLAVLITGSPIWIFMFYQTISAALSQFNHANIHLPKKIDTLISWIIVSPDMHKVHHHYVQPYSDSNYGNIFSIWDRLFGTFMKVNDTKKIVYGVDTHLNRTENSHILNLLKIPFQPYRPPVGTKNEKDLNI
ncbi:MAG: sterol desaturase family protein [Bacteroidetes bacterium]|nr:MAG: sterol desaturase family protein [Bacteroidota bacterium]TAG88478.1 MAG: sterol desaturase family protein [Bacteroidota bacterium]